MCVCLNKSADRNTWQTHISLRSSAEVDGVAVQTNVLQRHPDVAEVAPFAERIFMYHLDVVVLMIKQKQK